MKFVRQENTHTQKPFLQLWGWISFVSHFSLLIGTGTLYCIKDEDSSIMHTPLLYCSLVKKIYFSNDSYSLLCWPRKFKIKFLIYLSLFDQKIYWFSAGCEWFVPTCSFLWLLLFCPSPPSTSSVLSSPHCYVWILQPLSLPVARVCACVVVCVLRAYPIIYALRQIAYLYSILRTLA